jgi:hypothetical protein
MRATSDVGHQQMPTDGGIHDTATVHLVPSTQSLYDPESVRRSMRALRAQMSANMCAPPDAGASALALCQYTSGLVDEQRDDCLLCVGLLKDICVCSIDIGSSCSRIARYMH